MPDVEWTKEEILVNIQTAERQKPKLTREQMTAWFEQFRHGDPANRDFQKRLIDTFVNAVYVFDDKLVLTYNYQHGTQTISLEEIESALSSDFDGATPPGCVAKRCSTGKHCTKVRCFLVLCKVLRWKSCEKHDFQIIGSLWREEHKKDAEGQFFQLR